MAAARSAGLRQAIGAVAGLGALLMIGSSFLPWINTDTEDGGSTSITGWGGITGSSGIAGTNLNDVLDGAGTYRPGLIGAIFGVIALIAAIAIAAVAGGARPHRVTASVLVLCGLAGVGWGLFRGFDPGDAGVFDAGDAAAGIGPWFTALGGLVVLAVAVTIFVGVLDLQLPATGRRGIQPR
jgi:hypothetical protein